MIAYVRELNTILAGLCFFGLCYRTPQALAGVASKRLYLALAVFPVLGGFGSVQALVLHAPAGPVTVLFTLAYVGLGLVLIRWPTRLGG